MRKLLTIALPLLLALGPLAATDAAARSGFKLLPKTSLWAQIPQNGSKADFKAICDEMIARQNASAVGMMDASSLYMHGRIMGTSCVKVDYYKALTLAKASGDAFTLKAALTYIGGKARDGVGKAQRAMEKFEREQ